MKLLAWAAAFVAAFIVEASVLPRFLGAAAPSLTGAVLVLGIAFQGFWPGFAFAGLAGVLGDAAVGGGIHAFIALGVWLVMTAFRAFVAWEEPLGRIGAVFAGLAAGPGLWFLGARAAGPFFGVTVSQLRAADLVSGPAFSHAVFTLVWFALFVWFAVRWARRAGARRLYRL